MRKQRAHECPQLRVICDAGRNLSIRHCQVVRASLRLTIDPTHSTSTSTNGGPATPRFGMNQGARRAIHTEQQNPCVSVKLGFYLIGSLCYIAGA
jgi:hypothetical protein